MDGVGLVQARIGSHAVQEERGEGGGAATSQGKRRGELPSIGAVVGGQAHTGQEHLGPRAPEPLDDRDQIRLRFGDGLATQPIVDPECHDDDLGP